MVYGVYDNAALVHWPPSKIFVDEIRVSPYTFFASSVLPEPDVLVGKTRRLLVHLRRRTVSPER